MTEPKTLIEAVRHFSDLDVCDQYMIDLKWPDGKIVCPVCNGENIGRIASRRKLQCRNPECRAQFSARTGTIMEDSAVPINHWLVVIWAIATGAEFTTRSMAELLGMTSKTVWSMTHRIRMAILAESKQLEVA